ncbi:hypothetical protein [Thalassotalea mangrovi]|uniref:Uncharacterized protein n=1 Tax=Thalassotalea mangrovi TaxID=2572245 RepID=A0A4U1B4Y5_9GAMM|nr:hypothetical protein [Thalassotalea mangrovi]TKB44559.1 hypothetical protein E8M12_11800 [Thalassotalea mangrovi]
MVIAIILGTIWLVLMLRSGLVEYKYYQSVKNLEPDIWNQLGSPVYLKIPMVFVSAKGAALLKEATNATVLALAAKHRQAGIQFVCYVMLVLIGAIAYFKLA